MRRTAIGRCRRSGSSRAWDRLDGGSTPSARPCAVSSTLTWSAARADSNCSGRARTAAGGCPWSGPRRGAGGGTPRERPVGAGEALEAERLREAHDGRGGGVRAARGRAVWKATSSRWSTMYCATSFWGSENRRSGRKGDRVWCPWAAGGMVAVLGMCDPHSTWCARTPPRKVQPVMERLPTRLDGLVLLAPTVHRDERGFFLESFRADEWARPAFHGRSCRTTTRARRTAHSAGSTSDRPGGAGQARPVPGGRGLRRGGRPAARSRRRSESGRARARRQPRLPAVGATRLRPRLLRALSDVADVSTSSRTTTTPRPRSASRSPTPTWGSSGRGPSSCSTATATATPRGWPRSRTGCPSRTARERRRPLRPQPDGPAPPRQPAHGAAGVAVRPLGRRALPPPDRGPRRRASRREHEAGSSPTCAALGLDWDGEPVRGSPSARAVRARRSSASRPRAASTRASARARRSARRPRRRTGRCPRAPTPAPAALTAAERAARARRRPAAGAAVRARGGAGRVRRPAARRVEASSTTSSLRRNDGAPRLQPGGGGRRRRPGHRRGRPRRRPPRHRRRASCCVARLLGLPRPPTPTSRSCSGPTARGSPSATAR